MAEQNPYSLKVTLDAEENSVVVQVREKDTDGNFHTIGSEVFDGEGIDESIQPNVNLYGLSKLLQDRSSDIKAGPDKLAAMQEVYKQLCEGKWERERRAGAPTVSAEVEALAQLKGVDVASIQKKLRTFSKEQREQILANPKVVEIANQIRAQRELAEDVDLSDLAAA